MKKNYIKPNINVYEVKVESDLMAASVNNESGVIGGTGESDNEYGGHGFNPAPPRPGLWDDTDE